ncbi:MAG TPA: nuclear transport factor 2 family protein [Actinomycetota bacterium]|nr:nuclear transport factor 2 family protein [Actinomycetota bacterium]
MSSHEHPNVTLTREGLEAMERGDTAWFDQHIADDVIWHVGGNNKMSGEHRGKQAVMEMFGQGAGSITADAHDILANDDHAVVIGTARGTTPDGEAFEYKYVNVFHVRDGKTVEAWGMSENDAETDPIFDKLSG